MFQQPFTPSCIHTEQTDSFIAWASLASYHNLSSVRFAHHLNKSGNTTENVITLIYLIYTYSSIKTQKVRFSERRHKEDAELPKERNIHVPLFMLWLSTVLSWLQRRHLHRWNCSATSASSSLNQWTRTHPTHRIGIHSLTPFRDQAVLKAKSIT